MIQTISKDYLAALCCPSCSGQVIFTKEAIIFCQNCLLGFRTQGGVPDLRLSSAISFKKKSGDADVGLNVLMTVLMGECVNQSFAVKLDHCIMVGRGFQTGIDNNDATFVGKRPSATVPLDGHTQKLIEKFMAKKNKKILPIDLPLGNRSQLGDFERDPDFILNDPSVSRLHAIIYQDKEGIRVLDLVSKNGTFVNGKEVESAKLKHNDVISLGSISMRVNFL